jgi:ADP-heptose:LPS heptosyltransferase
MRYVYKKKRYLIFFSIIDAIGHIIFFPFRLNKSNRLRNPKRILLIREDHIGDVLSATAILKPLRKKYPNATIDFMAASWTIELVRRNPFIDNIVQFDAPWFDRRFARGIGQQCDRNRHGVMANIKGFFNLVRVIKGGGYDTAIDLRGDIRHITALFLARVPHRIGYGITGGGFLLTRNVGYEGILHETERNMALLAPMGVHDPPAEVKIYYSGQIIQNVAGIKESENLDRAYALLHAIPGNPLKQWRPEGFAQMANYIHGRLGLVPVMVGTVEDRENISHIISAASVDMKDFSGKLSLLEFAEFAKSASLFVGVDSGPAHIAGATGVPTVILFSGINDPRQWAPKGKDVRIVSPKPGWPISSIRIDDVCRVIEDIGKMNYESGRILNRHDQIEPDDG